jgi:hypothetical protein
MQKHLKDRFLITTYPTLILLSNGTFTEYKGLKDKYALRHFIEEGFVDHPFEEFPFDASLMKSVVKSWGKVSFLKRKDRIRIYSTLWDLL